MEEDRSGWATSAQAWITRIDDFDFAREVLLDKPMLRMCGPLEGRSLLDVGCGEGRFCRMAGAHGAQTTGLDPTLPLLETARARHPEGSYLVDVGEDLPFENSSFDVVVFYLTLIDIPDFRKAISEGARVLRPGGRMVIGNLASHASTTPNGWTRDADGKALYYALNNYMDAFLSCGLILREYLEPIPTLEEVAVNPKWADDRKVPYVVAMLWEKALRG